MSLTLGGMDPSSSSTAKTADFKSNPNNIQSAGTLSLGGAPATDYVTGILSRVMKPREMREFGPLRFHEMDPREIAVRRPEPLDRPDPAKMEARSYDTVEYRSLERVEAVEFDRVEIRQFDFPEPADLRPDELHDFNRPCLQAPDIMAIEASELKPAIRFEELFFQHREYIQPDGFEPRDFETVNPEPYRGQKAQYMDLADPDTYNAPARGPELHPRAAQAYQDRREVVHKFSHESMSHFHYHYQPVPADDVPAHRDRSVYLK